MVHLFLVSVTLQLLELLDRLDYDMGLTSRLYEINAAT